LKSNYANLDLLRSLAVLSVVASHLWRTLVDFHVCAEWSWLTETLHNLSGCGVMFFFVHTCLVLMLSMHRAPAAHLARSFLIRRAFRIYPLCWVTILLVLLTGLTDRSENNSHTLGWTGIAANFALLQNLLKQHGEASVLGPLWSLPWEVQMYLVLPFCYLLLRRSSRMGTVLTMWLAATLLAVTTTQPHFAHWHMHGAIFPPMFISGMVAYKLLERQSDHPRRAHPAWIWPLAVLALFAIPALQKGDKWSETPYGAVLGACVTLLLGLAIPRFAQLRTAWIVNPSHQIAKYSYGVYLLHVPAMYFVFRYLPGLPTAAKIMLCLVLTALIALLSFHTIEDPLIRLGKRLTCPAPVRANAISAAIRQDVNPVELPAVAD
jgi:peptidoglycan/LPS O-acetylase OafA/YrhL